MEHRAIGQEEETEVIMTGESATEAYKKILELANKEDVTTNFDRITESPEALAEWLNEHSDYCKEIQNWQCTDCPYSDKYCTRENQWLDWLMQESDTE